MTAPAKKTITNATNATPIIVTAVGHGFATANTVQIVGVTGNTAANGIWVINVIDVDTFNLKGGSVGNGAYGGGGTAQLVDLSGTSLTTQDLPVAEVFSTTGTGDLTLGGVVAAGYAPIGIMSEGQQAQYLIVDSNGAFLESGLGTYNKSLNTFSRTEIFATSSAELATNSPLNLQAGTKTIYVKTTNLNNTDVVVENFVQVQNGVPVPLVQGILTVRDSDTPQIVDDARTGPATNSIVFRRRLLADLEAGTVRLLQTSQQVICEPAALLAADMTQAYVDISIPRTGAGVLRLAVNAAPSLPFTVNGAKLPAQTTLNAFKPADVFIYLPHIQPGQPARPPALFYLNWYSNTARNNGNVGAPVGHEVIIGNSLNDWSYLDVSGPYSTFITSTEVFAKLPRRYLYLGTVGGITDGTVVNELNKMMLWNYWNRVTYVRSFLETTDGWGPPLTAGGRNSFTRMNPASYSQVQGAPPNAMYLSPWVFVFIVGKSPVIPGFNLGQVLAGNVNVAPRSAWATMAAEFAFVGNLRVKMAAFSDQNGNGETIGTDGSPPAYAITADIGNDTVNLLGTDGAFGNCRCVDTNIGMRIYHVMQALGTNPLGANLAANPVTPRFSGVASRITVLGEC